MARNKRTREAAQAAYLKRRMSKHHRSNVKVLRTRFDYRTDFSPTSFEYTDVSTNRLSTYSQDLRRVVLSTGNTSYSRLSDALTTPSCYKHGWETIGAKRLLKAGCIINNPYNLRQFSWKRRPLALIAYEYAVGKIAAVISGFIDPIPGSLTAVAGVGPTKNEVDELFFKKLGASVQRMSTTSLLVEGRKTKSHLQERFRDLSFGVITAAEKHHAEWYRWKRNRLLNTKHKIDSACDWLSQRWLEYSLAVKPIVGDVDGLLEALADRYRTERVIRHRVRLQYQYTSRSSIQSSYGGATWVSNETKSTRYTRTRGAAIYAEIPSMPQKIGFTLYDILPGLWEGVPYSWVADYFFNVGAWLESAQWANTKTRFQYETYKAVTDVSQIVLPVQFSNSTTSVEYSPRSYTSVTFDRSILPNTLGTYVPPLRVLDALNPMRFANLASLLKLKFF